MQSRRAKRLDLDIIKLDIIKLDIIKLDIIKNNSTVRTFVVVYSTKPTEIGTIPFP